MRARYAIYDRLRSRWVSHRLQRRAAEAVCARLNRLPWSGPVDAPGTALFLFRFQPRVVQPGETTVCEEWLFT